MTIQHWGAGDFLDRRAARLTLLEADGRNVEGLARRTVLMATGAEHGMEYCSVDQGDYSPGAIGLAYVNVGETYDATLVRQDPSGEWVWSSWGDALEAAEQQYSEDTEQDRCPQCGEWSGYVNHDTDRGACCGAVDPGDVDMDDVLEGAATALFASTYASECERVTEDNDGEIHEMLCERFGSDYGTAGSGEDWLDAMPDVPESAVKSAGMLLEAVAGMRSRIHGLSKQEREQILADLDVDKVIRHRCATWQEVGGTGNRFGSADWTFGYYLAAQAMGDGVGLSDDLPARFKVETPYWDYDLWAS